MDQVDIAVIGAGPHGLAAAAELRRRGREVVVFGTPMDFWSSMPKGLWMRSRRNGSSIGSVLGPLSMEAYTLDTQSVVERHLSMATFIEYGEWYARRTVPDVVRRRVTRVSRRGDRYAIEVDDGTALSARRVLVAAGIAPFPRRPASLQALPADLASHVADHGDYERFRGRSVAIVGAGQSALESAAILHEHGADVEVLARQRQVFWLHGDGLIDSLGPLSPLVYAPTDVGPIGISRLVATPEVFRHVPRSAFEVIADRAIRPAGAAWLRPRLADVPITAGTAVTSATPTEDRLDLHLTNGGRRRVDHLLYATGYDVDVRRYSFLDRALAHEVRCVGGYPVLQRGLESSLPRPHFLGAPAAHSFGPVMRFVSGSWFGSRAVARTVERQDAGRRLARTRRTARAA